MQYNKITLPLQQLINQKINDIKISRVELVKMLGYKNITKGLRRLDDFLISLHTPNDEFAVKLLNVLDIDLLAFYEICKTVQQNFDAKEDDQFCPHLKILKSFQPASWFAANHIHQQCTIQLDPKMLLVDYEKQFQQISSMYKARKDELTFKDKISGFIFHKSHNLKLIFNDTCSLIDICVVEKQNSKSKLFSGKVLKILLRP